MANTFIQLNDTPSEYTGNVQYLITAGNQIDFVTLSTNELVDVNTLGAYAPENGQVLQWFGGAEEFRPATVDPYSAGNGLSKSDNLTLNIKTLSGGGLAANSSGVFLETISGVAGTYGNTTHVPSFTVNDKGQITSASFVAGSFEVANSLTANHIRNIAGTAGQIVITGGTGVAANAVVELVATGVTAGTYGNATYSPIITVDTYGRIQNVDLVQNIGGGGGDGNVDLSTVTTEAFKSIAVAGQTTVSAESKDDTLTFVAGTGMAITTTAGTDTITFSSTGGGASVTVSDTAPVGASAGDLWWDSSTGKLKIYYDDLSSQQWVDASPASGTSADYSEGALILPNSQTPAVDEGSITWDPVADTLYVGDGTSAVAITGGSSYGNADVQSYLDAQGYSNVDSDSQTLSWDEANSNISISGGNTVTLTGVGGGYGNVDVQNYLDDQGYSNVDSDSQTLTWDNANANLSISGGNTVSLFDQSLDTTDDVTFAVATANVVAFNTTGGITAGVGEMTWNDTDATVDLGLGTATLQIGQEQYVYARANEDIDNGDIVMIVGALGSRLQVAKANVNAAGFKLSSVVGVATQAITNNNNGYITTFGKVRGINTSVFTDGDTVYLSDTTAGALTNVEPSASIIIGTVAEAAVNGTLFVKEFIDSQTLSWDQANSNLSISGGNTVTLTGVSGETYGIDESTRSETTDWLKIINNGDNYDVLVFNTDSTGAGAVTNLVGTTSNGGYQFHMGTNNQRLLFSAPGNSPKITGWANGISGNSAGLTIEGRTFTSTEGYLRLVAGGDQAIEMLNGITKLESANVTVPNLPTTDPSLADAIWLDNGVLVTSGNTAPLQSLTWDSANSNLSISGGNTVTLTGLSADNANSALTSDAVTRTVIAGENLAKGDAVYISGGTGDNPEVSKADADDPAKMPVFGITAEAVTVSNTTDIVINGELTSYDTTGFATGESLFVSTTPGLLSNVAPTGEASLLQKVGKVIKGNSTGGKITITGAGRSNATPNLNDGNIFIGNASNVAVSSSLDSAVSALGYAQISGGTFSASSVETGNVQPAAESTDSVDGNNLNINGGDATGLNSTGGTLILDAGTGALANGQVDIGTSNATQIDIGNGTSTTIIAGSVNTLGTFKSQGDALFDTGVQEAFSTINNATGTVTHDCDNGHIFRHTAPVANFTANFTNFGLTTDYATTVTLVIDQGATARIPTAVQIGGVAQTLLWQGGSPPTGTNNGEDVVSFSFLRTGASAYTVLGQLVGFS